MSDRNKGFLLAFLSAFLYGIAPIFGKKLVNDLSPLFVALIATFASDLYLAGIALWKKQFFHNFLNKNIKWVLLIGFLGALGSLFSFLGLSKSQANAASFFFQFETLFATFFAFIFLKEKLSKYQSIGFIVMFFGALVFITGFSLTFKASYLLFLGSAFVWGINDVIIKWKIHKISPLFLSFGRNFFSSIFLFFLAFQSIPLNIGKMNFFHVSYFLIYGAFIAGIILFLYLAFKYIKTSEATVFQLIIPLVTATAAFFTLGEYLDLPQIIGGLFILIGLFLMLSKPIKR